LRLWLPGCAAEKGARLKRREIRTFSSDTELVRRRREEIANGAVKVFLKKGYDKATMREVGEACGMTYGNLYNYIGSKADILHLICRSRSDANEQFGGYRNIRSEVSVTSRLHEFMTEYFKTCDQRSEYHLLFNREIHRFSRDERHALLNSLVDIVSIFEQLLSEGMETEEFQVRDPTLLAHNIVMFAHDWVLRKWFLKQHYTLEEYTEKQFRMVFDLLATNASQTTNTPQAERVAKVSSTIGEET